MTNKIIIKEIEHKWKEIFIKKSCSSINEQHDSQSDKHFYCLAMFPYPSGSLHMGHVRNYILGDVIARHKKLQGYQVLHPMGWDSFGLPAENAAIEHGMDPAIWTDNNISAMRSQFKSLLIDYDWNREIKTSDPRYYRWTEWIFRRLFERGLAYQSESMINWDPIDKTVLADEQVDSQGRAWRSGALVIKKSLKQWFVKITNYADRLLLDLDGLDWPESVKQMQRNWIGKQETCHVKLLLSSLSSNKEDLKAIISEPRYLCSANILLTPFHELFSPSSEPIRNPLTGELLKIIPYHENRLISPFCQNDASILKDALDQHSHESIHNVIEQQSHSTNYNIKCDDDDNSWRGHVDIQTSYKIRDWLISRQRKWGTPIPIIHCPKCNDPQLSPLPAIFSEESGGSSSSNDSDSSSNPEGLKVKKRKLEKEESSESKQYQCPKCSSIAQKELDTMDTFMDSSWYYMRFCNRNPLANDEKIFDEDMIKKWMPVNVYIGGIEHAVLHLLYARFIGKVLSDEFPHLSSHLSEPFKKLVCQGMVEGLTFKTLDGKYLKPNEVATNKEEDVIVEWTKMSKSKYNGVNPQTIIDKYGVDSLRTYIMFKAPPQIPFKWSETEIMGSHRWLHRLLSSLDHVSENENIELSDENLLPPNNLLKAYNECLSKVNRAYDPDNYNINTAIAAMMKFSNLLLLYRSSSQSFIFFKTLLNRLAIMLIPVAPHIGHEIYSRTMNVNNNDNNDNNNNANYLREIQWPDFIGRKEGNSHLTNKKTIIYQANGKFVKILDSEDELNQNYHPHQGQKLKRIELHDRVILNLISDDNS